MTIATAYAKRIVSVSTGYVCYLGPIEVGTADTYGQAEKVCAEAYEDMRHIDPDLLARLAKLTPTELQHVAEQVLASIAGDTPAAPAAPVALLSAPLALIKAGKMERLADLFGAMTVADFRTSVRWMVELHPHLLDWGTTMLDIVDGPRPAPHAEAAPAPSAPAAPQLRDAYAHIATLDNGQRVYGTYDKDGVTPACTYYETRDGYFFCGADGGLSGRWADQSFDFPAAALPALRTLFTSDVLPRVQEIAREWEGPAATDRPTMHAASLQLLCDMLGYVQNGMARWGLGAHHPLFSTFTTFVVDAVERAFGNVDYTPTPVLSAVMDARLTPAERAERDAA